MQAATIRRMIVFGVCAFGVGSLYLAPSMARSPDQVGLPSRDQRRTSAAPEESGTPPTPQAAATGVAHTAEPPVGETSAHHPGVGQPHTTRLPEEARHTTRGGTAFDPGGTPDHEPPTPVGRIDVAEVNPDRLDLSWTPAADNVAVIGYRLWLNGFEVATTAETHASLRWFNDDGGQHVVQIKAIDAAGNQSTTSPTLLVSRPSPGPTPTPEPSSPAATPTATPTSTPEPTPTGSPTDGAERTGSSTPTPSEGLSPSPDGPQ